MDEIKRCEHCNSVLKEIQLCTSTVFECPSCEAQKKSLESSSSRSGGLIVEPEDLEGMWDNDGFFSSCEKKPLIFLPHSPKLYVPPPPKEEVLIPFQRLRDMGYQVGGFEAEYEARQSDEYYRKDHYKDTFSLEIRHDRAHSMDSHNLSLSLAPKNRDRIAYTKTFDTMYLERYRDSDGFLHSVIRSMLYEAMDYYIEKNKLVDKVKTMLFGEESVVPSIEVGDFLVSEETEYKVTKIEKDIEKTDDIMEKLEKARRGK